MNIQVPELHRHTSYQKVIDILCTRFFYRNYASQVPPESTRSPSSLTRNAQSTYSPTCTLYMQETSCYGYIFYIYVHVGPAEPVVDGSGAITGLAYYQLRIDKNLVDKKCESLEYKLDRLKTEYALSKERLDKEK